MTPADPPDTDSSAARSSDDLPGRLESLLYEQSLDCVHCGLCLTSCPTYRATGRETASPRGRIYLMRGLVEGRLEDSELLEEEAFACLGCRACETACPSGVRYGAMLEATRGAIRESQDERDFATRVERLALREIVPKPRRLRMLVNLLALAQRLRLDRLAAAILPARLADMMTLLPRIPAAEARRRMPAFTPAIGHRRGRVALFEGCIMPEFFGRVNEAARLVLSRAGYEVVVPQAQGCCGALHAHSGDPEAARSLAEENLRAFVPELENFDALIVTSAGCSASLRESEHLLGERAGGLAGKTRDVLDFLDEAGLVEEGSPIDWRPLPRRVCYDDPCHLIHAQGVAAGPRRLLEGIPELELVPHKNPEACCGAAGIYNLTQPEMSGRVLAPKVEALLEAAPEIVATANPGCAMQIAAGLSAACSSASVVHPIELLEEASRPR